MRVCIYVGEQKKTTKSSSHTHTHTHTYLVPHAHNELFAFWNHQLLQLLLDGIEL